MSRQVAVTGMGILSPIGKNVAEFCDSLRAGRCGIDRLKRLSEPSISVTIGAEITDFSFGSMLERYGEDGNLADLVRKAERCAQRSPLVIQASVVPALEAWRQSRLHQIPLDSDRLGVIVAGSNLTQQYQYDSFPKFLRTPGYLTPRYSLHYLDTDQVGTLSEIFCVRGEGFTVGGASASGNVGILKGCQLIQSGIVDACLVVGALTDLSPMELQGFYCLGAMGGIRFRDEPKKACRPFDRAHEGFIYGQASGCLVLESSESARKRGVPVLAEILGGALVLDGNRLADPSEDGEVRAMESALQQAGIGAGDVTYVNAHGTSSPLGDKTEVRAMKRVFAGQLNRVWINSTKSLIGHCLHSAGVAECIATVLQMLEGFVHPNRNLENPIDDQCRFAPATAVQDSVDVAMSHSFAFGGINTSIVLRKGE